MSVNDGSAVSRQFVASPGFFGMGPKSSGTRNYVYMYGFLAVLAVPIVVIAVLNVGGHRTGARLGALFTHIVPVFLVLGIVAFIAYYLLHNRRKILISVTGDGLTVNRRPGDVYSFTDARLGLWGFNDKTMGTVLHLQCGAHRFVLGGRDHRIDAGTRIDEAPVPGVDAWVWAADFDELLSMAGPRSGVEVRPPAPGDPTRCLLFPNAMKVQQMGAFSVGRARRLMRSASHASLAIDVDGNGIRVIDFSSNTLIASAGLGQITATPATYQWQPPFWYGLGGNYFVDRGVMRRGSVTTEMVVCLPGMEELTIACRDAAGGSEINIRRFTWRGQVQQKVNDPADYSVSGADWLTLVEKFGLAPYLEIDGG